MLAGFGVRVSTTYRAQIFRAILDSILEHFTFKPGCRRQSFSSIGPRVRTDALVSPFMADMRATRDEPYATQNRTIVHLDRIMRMIHHLLLGCKLL